MVFEYPIVRAAPFNSDKLLEELKAVAIDIAYRTETAGVIIVVSDHALTQQEVTAVTAVVTNHDPSSLTIQQQGLAQLATFLDSRVDDLKYADYFYRLQKRLLDVWRDKPGLTARITEVIAALKANKDSDANHLAMYNVFLDVVQVEYGMTVTAGEVVFSGTTQQQAAQARTVIQCARLFCVEGVTMANMLVANRLLS